MCPTPVTAINPYTNGVNGIIPSYNQVDLSLTYRVGPYSIEGQVLNILDTQSLVTIKGKNYLGAGNGHFDLTDATIGGAPNANAPEYQAPTSFQLTLRAKFQ